MKLYSLHFFIWNHIVNEILESLKFEIQIS
jgi:hypothetical protein